MASKSPPERMSLGQNIPIPGHFIPSFSSSSSSQTTVGNTAGSQGVTSGVNSSSHALNSSPAASSSLVNPATLALSLPHSTQSLPITHVDSQALHYLTLEMPDALRSGVKRSLRKRKQGVKSLQEAGFSVDGLLGSLPGVSPADELESEVIKRLESIGSHVGANFAER
jgi:hypothetical protein